MATYREIQSRLAELSRQAETLRHVEVAAAIARIKSAIALYELTPADLGFGKKAKPAKKGATAKAPSRKRTTKKVKYRDQKGNTWVGRGKRPDWLRAALAAGKSLEDLRV